MQATDRITLVLRAKEGQTLEQVLPFVQLGAPVAIGRGLAVIAGASDEDLQMVLGQERDERWMQAQLQEEAIGAPAHLAAHAQEMFDLLHRINVKVGGLNAVVGHGGEPSDQMWEEHDEAMDAIWDLLAKVKTDASVDKAPVNQIAQNLENVNQQQNALQNIPGIIPGPWTDVQCLDFCSVALRHVVVEGGLQLSDINDALRYIAEKYQAPTVEPMHIDDRVRMAANAKRYEWLRDRTCIEDADNDLMVVRGDRYFDGAELDAEIDNALRLARLQELHPCAD